MFVHSSHLHRFRWLCDTPAVVYQTNMIGRIQDSATPLILNATCTDFNLADSSFVGSVCRFDGNELSEYDDATHSMRSVNASDAFTFMHSDDALLIEV
jgi:hypothetical protein